MILKILALTVLASGLLGTQAVTAQLPTGESPYERTYTGIKLLDAYFGTVEEKMEIEPGDFHVPFTVVLANVGNSDIVGLTGDLVMPINFGPVGSSVSMIRANAEANVKAGEHITLTFYTDVGEQTKIGKYKGTVKTEYSRLRETGQRTELFTFSFELVGRSIIDASAVKPFVSSLNYNDIVISIENTGSSSASGIVATLRAPSSGENEEYSKSSDMVIFKSSWNVGNINAGGIKNITTNVYVPGNLAGKTIKLPLDIKYFDAQGVIQNVERTVDIYVQGLVDLYIYGIDVIDISDKQTIIGQILNEGNEKALFTFVTINPREGSNIKSNTQFIDDIDTDSPVPFNMPIEFNGAPRYGSHEIKIDVRYKDGIRNETTVVHNSTILIPEPVSNNENDTTVTALFVLLAALVITGTLVVIKKRKKS